MARRRTKAAREAQALLVWLESLELPTRVINALRRDLEVITGEREGEEGSGVLAGLDQARFTEELYRPRGGQVGKVATVAKSAVEALRAAIPAPVSGDPIEAVQPAQGDEEPAARENAEATPPAQGAVAAPAPEPAPADDAPAAAAEAPEVPAETAQEAAELADVPAAPKRRGRPPRAAAAGEAEAAPAEAPAAPAKRRGRPPRDEAASDAATDLPPRTRRARVAAALAAAQPAAPPVEVPAPAPAAAPPVADPSFAVLLRLWRELHPQGRRAAAHYMAGLLAEM